MRARNSGGISKEGSGRKMTHPNQATLALHAGGDLGLWARWKTQRHLSKCDLCRDEVAAFTGVREILPELVEIPEVPWNRLAAEMRANIRLGLEAGECVRDRRPDHFRIAQREVRCRQRAQELPRVEVQGLARRRLALGRRQRARRGEPRRQPCDRPALRPRRRQGRRLPGRRGDQADRRHWRTVDWTLGALRRA